jgi:hypothetical protein
MGRETPQRSAERPPRLYSAILKAALGKSWEFQARKRTQSTEFMPVG